MPAPAPAAAPPHKASPVRTTSTASRRRVPGTAPKPVTHRWTPPELFKPLILDVLQDAGRPLETDEMLAALEEEIGDRFLAGDHETRPGGELRWHYAARRARQALISEGLMAGGKPGVWQVA